MLGDIIGKIPAYNNHSNQFKYTTSNLSQKINISFVRILYSNLRYSKSLYSGPFKIHLLCLKSAIF